MVEQPGELAREVVAVVAPTDHRSAQLEQRQTAGVDAGARRQARPVSRRRHGLGLPLTVDSSGIAEGRKLVPQSSFERLLAPRDFLAQLFGAERGQSSVRA